MWEETVLEAIVPLLSSKSKRCSEITLTGGDVVITKDEKSVTLSHNRIKELEIPVDNNLWTNVSETKWPSADSNWKVLKTPKY